MASLCRRVLTVATKRHILASSARCSSTKITFGDPVEHATGLEKLEILAALKGNKDPYYSQPIKKGPGTRAQPTEVPSAFSARIVGCNCEDEATSISFMWVHMDEPKRCECGHWYKLVSKPPL